MKYILRLSFILLNVLLAFAGCTQTEKDVENSDEPKILSNWKPLTYQKSSVQTFKFPQRKYDSPFFCDELIPYKDGYIINSITSNKAGRIIEVTTSFYYFNLKTRELSQLTLPGVDTIESLLSNNKNDLYSSYIKSGKRIISFGAEPQQNIIKLASSEIKIQLDTAKWIKLGYNDNKIYALSPNALFLFSENKWTQVTEYSLDEFYVNALHYKRSLSVLPTENLIIVGDKILFLQEIVQERSCRLLQLDMKTGQLSDFFISQGYIDNYFKQVNDFSILHDQSILVSASRLIGNYMVLKANKQKNEVWIFNNSVSFHTTNKEFITASTAAISGDSIFLAGSNGLFVKYMDTITPLILWVNTHQEIKDKEGDIDFEFVPRSLMILPDKQFLVGGMWGGLYLIDLIHNRVTCVDDVPEKKVKNLNLGKL